MLAGSSTAFNLTSLVTRRSPRATRRLVPSPTVSLRAAPSGPVIVLLPPPKKIVGRTIARQRFPGIFISPRSRDFGKRAGAREKCPSRTLGEFCAVE
jgi:hypothetical protein